MTNQPILSEAEQDDNPPDDPPDNPPKGFERARSRSLYSRRNGPYYFRVDEAGDVFRQGVRIRLKHCNGSGVAHGGMLSSVADNTMAGAAYRHLGVRSLTVQMNMEFMAVVKPGDWLESVGRVRHTTQTMVFCDAELFAGDRLVMRASGIFRRARNPKRRDDGGSS